MFYSFKREENLNDIIFISDYVLNYNTGLFFILISLFFVILKNFIPKLNNYNFIIFSFFAFGIYISTFFAYDETFINLDQIYNLYHFKKLSMSPTEMVNGTVDYIFCLLLLPFASTREMLLVSNYALNFAFLFIHFWVLYSYIRKKTKISFLILIIFASYLPFTWIFGKGFGNNIVSLVFFYSLILYFENKIKKSLLVASFLPLLRPDAILYSFSIFFAHFLKTKKIEIKYISICLLNFSIFFLFTYILYDQFIPTPMEFKSISISELYLINFETLFINSFNSYNLFFLICLLLSYLLIKNNSEIVKIYYFFIPLFVVFAFYSLNPETYKFSRYSIGFFLLQSLFFIFLIINNKLYFSFKNRFNYEINLNFLSKYENFFSSIIIILIIPILIHIQNTRYASSRIDALSIGGQIVEKIIPKNWLTAVTELNTFGFSNDLEIYDMWGYSNKIIAKSKIRSLRKKKIAPDLFLTISPEIFWYRTENTDWKNYQNTKRNPELILSRNNFSKSQNFIGDMNEVLKFYDFYSITYKTYETLLLVHKDKKKLIFDNLNRNKFNLSYSKEIDIQKFKTLY